MTINALAEAATVPATSVWDYESDVGKVQPGEIVSMRQALENAGVEFIDDVGVKLGKNLG